MLRSFGMELYGVLTVTWMLLGQLGWLNLGLGRAATRFVARDLSLGEPDRAGRWAWSAMATQVAAGATGAAFVWVFAPALVDLLSVRPENYDLVVFTLRAFALAIPLELASSSLRGVLEATQSFGTLNALGVVEALWTYGVYAVAIGLGGDLPAVVYGLVGYKVVIVGVLLGLAGRALPSLLDRSTIAATVSGFRSQLGELLGFGGWIAAAQGAGPILLYSERWMISGLLGAAALPLYTVPSGLLQRLAFLPASLTSTLFPAYTDLHARGEWSRLDEYFVRSNKYLLLALVPILFVVFVGGRTALTLWIGAEFAAEATVPLQVVTLGFVVALLAPLSGALLEGAGRPDIIPKVYAVELPLSLFIVYALTSQFGVVGAAWSFVLRAGFETGAIWVLVYRVLPVSREKIFAECVRPFALAILVLGASAVAITWADLPTITALAVSATVLAGYAAYAALVVVDGRDRDLFSSLLNRVGVR